MNEELGSLKIKIKKRTVLTFEVHIVNLKEILQKQATDVKLK